MFSPADKSKPWILCKASPCTQQVLQRERKGGPASPLLPCMPPLLAQAGVREGEVRMRRSGEVFLVWVLAVKKEGWMRFQLGRALELTFLFPRSTFSGFGHQEPPVTTSTICRGPIAWAIFNIYLSLTGAFHILFADSPGFTGTF